MKIHTSRSRGFFYLLIAAVLGVSYLLLKDYLSVMILAFLTVLVFDPVFEKLMIWTKYKTIPSLIGTLITIVLVLLIPLLIVANLIIIQTNAFYEDVQGLLNGQEISLEWAIDSANIIIDSIPFYDYEVTQESLIQNIQSVIEPVSSFILTKAVDIGSSSFGIITGVILYVAMVWSLFPNKNNLLKLLEQLSPLDNKIDRVYVDRVLAMSKAMAKGVFLVAIAQGVLGGFSLWIVGVPYVVFWTVIMIVASIIPVGAGLITIPAAIVFFMTGGIWQGVFLLIMTFLVIGNIDNVLRPRLVPKEAALHPVLVLLGVFGGLNLFGFLGVIYGPVIMIILTTTLEIYKRYYKDHK